MKKPKPNPESEAFAARLRHAMKEAGLKASATQLADAFNLRYWGVGITSHAARNWMIGASLPKQDKLKTLGDILQISPQDLLFGPRSEYPAVKETSENTPLSLGDSEMLRQFLQLNKDQKKMIRHVVKLALIYQNNCKDDPDEPETEII